MKKNYFVASVGNIVEFYDFALYGFITPILAKLFFPNFDELSQLFATFNIFAIGFLARPLGAVFFGFIGDHYGRKVALLFSILGIAIASVGIGLTPTYEQASFFAPLLLCLFRFLQGLCMGGEFSASLVFVSEHLYENKARYPALVIGVVISSGVLGWLFASISCISFVQNEGWWSWRIPFIIGGIIGVMGYYMRSAIVDAYPTLKQTSTPLQSLKATLQYPWLVFQVISIGIFVGALFYGQFIFPNSFLPKIIHIDQKTITTCTSIGLIAYMFLLPLAGWVADKLGHLRSLLISCSLSIITSYFIFTLFSSGSVIKILIAQFLAASILALFIAPATLIMSLLFPRNIRCFATSLSYNIGVSIFGGIAPSISLALYQSSKNAVAPSYYLSFCALITFIAVLSLLIKNTYHFEYRRVKPV